MKKEYDLKKLKIKRRGVLPALQTKGGATSKIRITIALDKDVIDYFKAEARQPGAFPYQTQINQTLRQIINQGPESRHAQSLATIKSELLHDPHFLRDLAKRVAQKKAGR